MPFSVGILLALIVYVWPGTRHSDIALARRGFIPSICEVRIKIVSEGRSVDHPITVIWIIAQHSPKTIVRSEVRKDKIEHRVKHGSRTLGIFILREMKRPWVMNLFIYIFTMGFLVTPGWTKPPVSRSVSPSACTSHISGYTIFSLISWATLSPPYLKRCDWMIE